MSSIIQLRNLFGLSQSSLAIYLSVSVSLIKMVEQGKRELPTTASLKIAQLQSIATSLYSNQEEILLQPPTDTNNAANKELRFHVNWFEKQLQNNKSLLIDMQSRYQQATYCLQLINHLSHNLPLGDEGKKDNLWLELLQLEAKEKIKKYGKRAQALLQWKITCYLHNLLEARKALILITDVD